MQLSTSEMSSCEKAMAQSVSSSPVRLHFEKTLNDDNKVLIEQLESNI